MVDFEEQCTDITSIFIGLDLPRPYIHPLNDGLVISIGIDTYHDDIFPMSTLLFKLLDNYMGTNGLITITNNSLGDAFHPNISIEYKKTIQKDGSRAV